jgi:hypothetical protein
VKTVQFPAAAVKWACRRIANAVAVKVFILRLFVIDDGRRILNIIERVFQVQWLRNLERW